MNIYVGNISYSATEDQLREAFAAYGEVSSVAIVMDKYTGNSRGFAFVEMPSQEEAQAAIDGLNGNDWMDRKLIVNQARPRTERRGNDRGRGGQ
ncbi:MAG: RNA-binding protein [Candidatus Zixiibacteriota bacterium]|nr:MAG: RNA-binding protein [candidate division Zixibacteria bacterium]